MGQVTADIRGRKVRAVEVVRAASESFPFALLRVRRTARTEFRGQLRHAIFHGRNLIYGRVKSMHPSQRVCVRETNLNPALSRNW
jgi:hypothetical protein